MPLQLVIHNQQQLMLTIANIHYNTIMLIVPKQII